MCEEQSFFFSTRYLMMRGENHWLVSHQHVRSVRHASLLLVSSPPSFPLLDNLFCALANCGTSYATTHLIIAFFRPSKNSGTFRAHFAAPYAMDDRMMLNEHQFVPIRTPSLSPTVNPPGTSLQRSAPSCPFLETRSLSLPTSYLAASLSTSNPSPVYPTSLSRLISPDYVR